MKNCVKWTQWKQPDVVESAKPALTGGLMEKRMQCAGGREPEPKAAVLRGVDS
jgi:hypothetical protein